MRSAWRELASLSVSRWLQCSSDFGGRWRKNRLTPQGDLVPPPTIACGVLDVSPFRGFIHAYPSRRSHSASAGLAAGGPRKAGRAIVGELRAAVCGAGGVAQAGGRQARRCSFGQCEDDRGRPGAFASSCANRVNYWLHPDAEAELAEAAVYYAKHASRSVAEAFLAEFEHILDLLVENQLRGPRGDYGLRVHQFDRFPYTVVLGIGICHSVEWRIAQGAIDDDHRHGEAGSRANAAAVARGRHAWRSRIRS